MMREDLISIVVPVYNVENYIRECIDSILDQTYPKFELLLIDDGSTDNSGKICDEYIEKDERIITFHKPNGGLSDARNYGIENAQGQYITFIDSDDVIGSRYLETLISLIHNNNALISVVGISLFEDGERVNDCDEGNFYYESRDVAMTDMLVRRHFGISACAKLYDKSLFAQTRFPIGLHFEDLYTVPYILWESTSVAGTSTSYYHYRQRDNSIIHSTLPQDDCTVFLNGMNKLKLFVEENYPSGKDAMNCRFMNDLIGYIINRLVFDKEYIVRMKAIISECKNDLKLGIKNKYLPYKRRLILRTILISPRLYKLVYCIKVKRV